MALSRATGATQICLIAITRGTVTFEGDGWLAYVRLEDPPDDVWASR